MGENLDVAEVSFFDLAWQLEMTRGRGRRWRDQRDSIPARRRRRRSRRRDKPASQYYRPVEVDPDLASRGVRARLAGGVAAALVTAFCLLTIFWTPVITLASAFSFFLAIGSLGLSFALIMSARREELVHQMADRLNREPRQPRQALPFEPEIDSLGSLFTREEEHRFDYDGHTRRRC